MTNIEFKLADEYDLFTGVMAYTHNEKPQSEIYVNSILLALLEKHGIKIYDINDMREKLVKFGEKIIDEHFDEFIEYLVEVIEHESIHCVLNKLDIHDVIAQEFAAFVVEGVRNPKIINELDKIFAQHGDYEELDNKEIIEKIKNAVAKLLGFKSIDELYMTIS